MERQLSERRILELVKYISNGTHCIFLHDSFANRKVCHEQAVIFFYNLSMEVVTQKKSQRAIKP